MAKLFRITLILIAVGVAGLTAYICFLVWSFHYGVEATRVPFSPTVWKKKANVYAHNNDPGCVRGDMALDIIATDLLNGKTVAAVKYLLGEPDGIAGNGMYFELGQCSGLGWHNSILQINFQNNRQVSDVVIIKQ